MRTFCQTEVHGVLCHNEVTEIVGDFKVEMLPYLQDLIELDVTGCVMLNANEFSDYIQSCSKLTALFMSSCTQFRKHHLIDFIPNLSDLEIIDISQSGQLDFTAVYEIVSSVPNLQFLNFEPEGIMQDRFKWREFVRDFFGQIEFGMSVMRFFPALNQNKRILKGSCEE